MYAFAGGATHASSPPAATPMSSGEIASLMQREDCSVVPLLSNVSRKPTAWACVNQRCLLKGRVGVTTREDDFAGKCLVALSHPFREVGAVFERVQFHVEGTFAHFTARPASVVYIFLKAIAAPGKAVCKLPHLVSQ